MFIRKKVLLSVLPCISLFGFQTGEICSPFFPPGKNFTGTMDWSGGWLWCANYIPQGIATSTENFHTAYEAIERLHICRWIFAFFQVSLFPFYQVSLNNATYAADNLRFAWAYQQVGLSLHITPCLSKQPLEILPIMIQAMQPIWKYLVLKFWFN